MGRKMKRIALDFDWPIDKVWKGYINPFNNLILECLHCDGSSYSPKAKNLLDQWWGDSYFDPSVTNSPPITINDDIMQELKKRHNWSQDHMKYIVDKWNSQWQHHLDEDDIKALVDDSRLWDFTRKPRTEKQIEECKKNNDHWMKESNGYVPTTKEVNDWAKVGFGHDGINQYVCLRAKCKRFSIEMKCSKCNGNGDIATEEDRKKCEEWISCDPPIGDGFQLWETTSLGSPQSPVFKTVEELAGWCEGNATTFGSHTSTKKEWLSMFNCDFIKYQDGNNVFI